MKRIKPNYLMLIMLALCAQLVSAYDIEINGIYYNVPNGVGSASVTYKTDSYNSYSGNITIPESVTYNGRIYPVTHIEDHAFQDCNNLTSITIPNSMRAIQDYAFYGCTNLTNVSIPNNVWMVGQYTFMGCTNLASVTFGSSVEEIRYQAFANCVKLTSITFPNSVTQIAIRAFENCSSLAEINIPNSVIHIGEHAFINTKWLENQPDGLVYAGLVAYKYKGTMPYGTTITIRDGTPMISASAFAYCDGLINVVIPNSVIEIGARAFWYCSGLISINIPNSVTKIETQAFQGCTSLASVTMPDSMDQISPRVFYGCTALTSLTIPSVYHIGDYAFYTNNTLDVTLNGNIDYIGSNIFSSISNLFISSKVTSLPRISISSLPYSGISPNNIYSYSIVPPTCHENTFSSYTGTLHVPGTSVASYFTADYWCNFANIMGDAVEPNTISLSQTTLETLIGEQQTLSATILPNNAYPTTLNWISTNPTIATVSNGIVTALTAGECDIIVSCVGKRAICHVVVKDPSKIIILDQNETCVLPNHIISLIPTSSPEVMANLAVTSSDPTVAATRIMNEKVQVVGIKEGTTTITVGSIDGTAIPASCLVTVYTEPGDLNCDGFINIGDVTSIIDYLLNGNSSQISTKNADVNGDGNINIGDATTLIDLLLNEN